MHVHCAKQRINGDIVVKEGKGICNEARTCVSQIPGIRQEGPSQHAPPLDTISNEKFGEHKKKENHSKMEAQGTVAVEGNSSSDNDLRTPQRKR
jgi:hypothetical protein